ncbi:hypothetical protein IMZ68_04175, partial [Candidatus Bathyarchaeota archaeon]|nr:hypothetical protein [Candidatus Bathyarchaeota archaeon]
DNADYFGHKTNRAQKGIKEIVGVLKNPYEDGNELKAAFHVKPSAQWLKDDLAYFAANDALDTYQLSIDSGYYQDGTVFAQEVNGQVPNVIAVAGGDVDIVPNGAAGGKFNRMVAAKENNNSPIHNSGVTQMKNKLLQVFMACFPAIFMAKNIDIVGVDENELYSHLYAADKSQPRMHLPEGYDKAKVEPILDAELKKIQATKVDEPAPPEPPKPPESVNIQASLDPITKRMQALELQACQAELRSAVLESKLPDVIQTEITKQFTGKIFASQDLNNAITSYRQIAAHFTQAQVDNRSMDVRITATEASKMENALAATILCSGNQSHPMQLGQDVLKNIVGDAKPIRSIKQLYIDCTGDVDVTGNPAKMTKMLAATGIDSTQFSVVVGNALNKALVSDYNYQDKLVDINKVCNITDLNSIQEQKRIRFGGYADAPTVTEGSAYLPATSPDDEEAVFTPVKKGFTEDITLETIKKDDINAVNKIPSRISKSCVNIFYKTVFGLLDPGVNAVIYDTLALYITSTHTNYATSALDTTALQAAIARMLAQVEAGSSDILGIRAGYILVPSELIKTAFDLVTYGQYASSADYTKAQNIQVLPVPYWSGKTPAFGNKARNWALTSRREDGVPIEAGFVDGQRTPELFVSNLANVGSLFTNDKITYKVRFWFGAAVIDFRFTDGSIVA